MAESWTHPYDSDDLVPPIRGIGLHIAPQALFVHVPAFLSRKQIAMVNECDRDTVRLDDGDGEGVHLDEKALTPGPDLDWLYDHLWAGLESAAGRMGLTITGIYETALALSYGVRDSNNYHSDYHETDRSKVAVSIILNDRKQYRGGDLDLLQKNVEPLVKAGDALFFAGFLAHRVTPVTSGTRKVLVAWAGGPALV